MEMNPKKRCVICNKWYIPEPRTKAHQQCCGRAECKKAFKVRTNKSWQKRHPDYGKTRKVKIRDWAQQYPNYWQEYRRTHPDYCARDNKRRQSSRQQAKNAAKQDAMREIAVEKLASIPRCEPKTAAKQALMDRRLDTVVECLLWLMCAAKQDKIELLHYSAVNYPHGTTDMGRNQAAV